MSLKAARSGPPVVRRARLRPSENQMSGSHRMGTAIAPQQRAIGIMVPPSGIEPLTSSLPRMRTTTVLRRHLGLRALPRASRRPSNPTLAVYPPLTKGLLYLWASTKESSPNLRPLQGAICAPATLA